MQELPSDQYHLWPRQRAPDSWRYFGGGGQSIQTVDPYAGTGVRELLNQLNAMISPQIGQGVEAYPGQMVAGVSPLQQQGFGVAGAQMPSMATGAMQYFQDVLGQQAAGGDQYQQLAGTTLQNLMQPWNPEAETELWQKQFVSPAMQTWQQDVMPAIMERYGEGGIGGALGQELGRSGRDLTTNLAGQLANILYSGQQAQLGRQQAGIGQAMQMAGLPGQIVGQAGQIGGMGTDVLGQLLNMGTMQRGITGEQLQEPWRKWQYSRPYENPYLQNFLGTILGQKPMQSMVTQSAPGLGSQLLPVLGSYLGGGGSLGGLGSGIGGALGSLGSTLFGTPGSAQIGISGAGLIPGSGGLLGGIGGMASGAASGIGSLVSALASMI